MKQKKNYHFIINKCLKYTTNQNNLFSFYNIIRKLKGWHSLHG